MREHMYKDVLFIWLVCKKVWSRDTGVGGGLMLLCHYFLPVFFIYIHIQIYRHEILDEKPFWSWISSLKTWMHSLKVKKITLILLKPPGSDVYMSKSAGCSSFMAAMKTRGAHENAFQTCKGGVGEGRADPCIRSLLINGFFTSHWLQ